MSEKYIKIDDAIKAVRKYRKAYEHIPEVITSLNAYMKDAYIPTYTPAEIMAGMWVPVTERLPRPGDGDWVLGIATATMGNLRLVNAIALVGYDPQEGWFLHERPMVDAVVTHWMPLPQPPKEADHG